MKPETLDVLSERMAKEYRQRQSLRFLECAINLAATDFRPEEVAIILRQHAKMLEEWG